MSLAEIETNSEVVELIGEPMQTGMFVLGSIQTSGPGGNASLQYSISGPKGEAKAYVSATKQMGSWVLQEIIVYSEKQKERVQVVAPINQDAHIQRQ